MDEKVKVRLEPMFKRILVELENENPYRKQKTDSGLILPSPNMIHGLVNKEQEGYVDGGERRVVFGVIVEVS